METCHRHQFFIVIAQFNREHFFNHLLTNAEPHPDLSFLNLHLHGPFDLDDYKSVNKIGADVLGPDTANVSGRK